MDIEFLAWEAWIVPVKFVFFHYCLEFASSVS
jgi:hypothetical protein